nr:hypothetical protein [uncultured Kingella sp.]
MRTRLIAQQTIDFQAAFAWLKGSLKHWGYCNPKSGYGGDTPCSGSNYANA